MGTVLVKKTFFYHENIVTQARNSQEYGIVGATVV